MTTFLLLIAAPPFRRVAFGIWPVMIMRRQFYGSWHRRHEQERSAVALEDGRIMLYYL